MVPSRKIGQQAVVQRLGVALNACKKLKEPMAHILFDGPPGVGKTTFAVKTARNWHRTHPKGYHG